MTIRVNDITVVGEDTGTYLLSSYELPFPMLVVSKSWSAIGGDLKKVLPSCKRLQEITQEQAIDYEMRRIASVLVYEDRYFTQVF